MSPSVSFSHTAYNVEERFGFYCALWGILRCMRVVSQAAEAVQATWVAREVP